MAHWLEEVGSRALGLWGPEVLGAYVNLLVGKAGSWGSWQPREDYGSWAAGG